ncbi:porin family protein [Rahnella aquatilis]|uniref:Porin n=1 Tax=Rahnella aquatilis (strain ATCC 33071 / DSM 4594 / JCM 1683 / NBRC 105701 / NCIMB 13365 / CIP 78.65) TaxID=745277 RepID=H2IWN4_RAHAC|nr:hypothetical protein [Rahnella aquatilis]AEX54083.1 hypothetical protein Rahaq2_4330 [Rahnella aquatilis CIP 78.65 = ATCC 33071]KFD00408.1 putative exported protein [Rahnella aquatilis CIP 78.65 = ATCC 33071]
MNKAQVISCLCLTLPFPIDALAEEKVQKASSLPICITPVVQPDAGKNEVIKPKPENINAAIYPGEKIRMKHPSGKVVDAVISVDNDNIALVELEEGDTGYNLHGNWLTEYKIEHFRNEGSSHNSRPVHEWVFGDGRVNLGDTGFNLGFVLKKVSFKNEIHDASNNHTDFRMTEMEVRPAYAYETGKHWMMFEAIYLGKTGYEKPTVAESNAYLIGGDGYGFRPYYRYQATDKLAVNTDLKWLTEDKGANGADSGEFVFYEALLNVSYRVTDDFTVGTEFFRKEGNDYDRNGNRGSNVVEKEIRPWATYHLDKHNFLLKMEPQHKRIKDRKGNETYSAKAWKYIVNYSYAITPKVYFVSEVFYRTEGEKEIDGMSGFDDQTTNFGKVGFNFIF